VPGQGLLCHVLKVLGLRTQVPGAVAEPLDDDHLPAGRAQSGHQRVERRHPPAVAGHQQHRAWLVLRHRVDVSGRDTDDRRHYQAEDEHADQRCSDQGDPAALRGQGAKHRIYPPRSASVTTTPA
jgi:hypothetical protein